MKDLAIQDGIIPIGKFKGQASRVIQAVYNDGAPVVITQNGSAVAVLINPQDFDAFCESQRFMRGVREGLDDSERGRVLKDKELTAILVKRYGKK